MTTTARNRDRYSKQRPEVTPPHISLATLRGAVGLTIEQLCDRIEQETGDRPSRGTISAIESGKRGVSAPMLVALARAYGLPDDAISTTYRPRGLESIPA